MSISLLLQRAVAQTSIASKQPTNSLMRSNSDSMNINSLTDKSLRIEFKTFLICRYLESILTKEFHLVFVSRVIDN